MLTQLARLIGLRLENARLYEAEHRIASTLQHSLLPQSLPRVPGAIVASRYLPGSSEAEVGGDWYDVIAAPDDQLFLVIGDVVGKGVQAAAGMGQLRNALRAYILEGFDCGEALTRLNRLVDNLGRRQFATVVCVRFDPRDRRAALLRRPGTRRRCWSRRARPARSSTRPALGPADRRAQRRRLPDADDAAARPAAGCCSTPTAWSRTARSASTSAWPS